MILRYILAVVIGAYCGALDIGIFETIVIMSLCILYSELSRKEERQEK